MVVVVSVDCDVPLHFLRTTALLVCLLQSFLPNNQPHCISFALMQDKVCALVQDEIFVLVQDEISFCCGEVVCSIILCRSVVWEFLLVWTCF